MAASRGEYEESDRQRRERIAIVDAELKAQQAKLGKVADRLLEADKGGEPRADRARLAANATAADKRRVLELLRLKVTVRDDPSGVKLGRIHRFHMDWETRVRVLDSSHGWKYPWLQA